MLTSENVEDDSTGAGGTSGGGLPIRPEDYTVEALDLGKRFGDLWALKSVSFAANKGELVACIGPNGAGKTTLLTILAGILEPDEGTIDLGPRRVGWVPQEPAVYRKLSVAENLKLFARLEDVDSVSDATNRMLEQTDLRERSGDPVEKLSGGNMQRVNIAIGLLARPDVLLLDEPTAALDPRQRERTWQFIHDLAGSGTTIVFASHNIEEVERYADKVLVLADGDGLFAGSPKQLLEVVVSEGAGDFDDYPNLEAAFMSFLHSRGH